MKKLAIITTHPIQYYAPVFKLLHERQKITIKVFYTWGESSLKKYDPGFDKKIEWDTPLLDGYPYEWVKNDAKEAGTHHFNGIINPGLTSQVKAWNPDAVLVYGWAFNSHLKIIRYFKDKVPVLFRGDSTLLDRQKGIKALLKGIFLKWVYRHVDHAFYVGTNNKAYFKKHGLKDNQLSFAPHAIDNARFAADRKNEAALLRQSLGIKEDELIIMFAGKFEEKKDPILLMEAFLNLSKPGIHLLFIGNGPLEVQLKLNAKGNDNIHFMDFQNQSMMPVTYQACDLFCLPSKGPGETWGLAINEAMACGKAILVSDRVGCVVDLVKSGQNGATFKAAEINDITGCLQQLTNDKIQLVKYGERSRIIIKDWNFTNIALAIENKILDETH